MSLLSKIIVITCLLMIPSVPTVRAHFEYPYPCCGGYDCGPIVDIKYIGEGDRYITIKLRNDVLRTALFPKGYITLPPLDEHDHACIGSTGLPMCLFLNGGV